VAREAGASSHDRPDGATTRTVDKSGRAVSGGSALGTSPSQHPAIVEQRARRPQGGRCADRCGDERAVAGKRVSSEALTIDGEAREAEVVASRDPDLIDEADSGDRPLHIDTRCRPARDVDDRDRIIIDGDQPPAITGERQLRGDQRNRAHGQVEPAGAPASRENFATYLARLAR
jgi:hypothetical protein